jgi:class 3 adenylate cyclase
MKTSTPVFVTFAVALVFLCTIGMFFIYTYMVEKRQTAILEKAIQSTHVVSSLFPKQVREQLLENILAEKNHPVNKIKSFLANELNPDQITTTTSTGKTAIAEFFPQCTVLFGDIAGFTAWSSTRAPEHVFVLLQSIFQRFDQVAKNRHVFKVETIGDCYVAVTGLPEPQPRHALIMARFAWDCMEQMARVVRDLEVQLGPDCSDLRMRFGLNSGPVTAGVLLGDRARFQLFGDTVNTGALIVSYQFQNIVI